MAAHLVEWSDARPATTLQYRVVGTPTWTSVDVSNLSSYTVTGLLSNTLYEYRLSRVCGSVTTTSPTARMFRSDCPSASSVTLTATALNYNIELSDFTNITSVRVILFRNNVEVQASTHPVGAVVTGSFVINPYDGVYDVVIEQNVRGYLTTCVATSNRYLRCPVVTDFNFTT